MAVGFTLPFAQSSGSVGYFETTNNELSAVRENIKSILLTNWGERPMRYDFGCNLIEFVFENESNEETRQLIADRIYDQISRWMPFVRILQLNILQHEDDQNVPVNGMGIRLKFALVSRPDLTAILQAKTDGGGWVVEEN